MRAWARVQPVDAVVAGALATAALAELGAPDVVPGATEVIGSWWVLVPTALGMTLPLAWRRSLPLVCAALVLGSAAAQNLLTTSNEGLSALAAALLASYSVSAYGTRRTAAVGLLLVLGAAAAMGAEDDLAFVLLLLVPAWSVGLLLGRRSQQVAALVTDRQALLVERQAAAARGAEEERRRIARELHDVVAHRVSMMVVQAQSADALLSDSPERARDSIRAVEEAGREALTELRSLLGLLRSSADAQAEAGPLTPSSGFTDIEQLVVQARGIGVPVDLTINGPQRPVGEIVGAAAYRVVQESVTNVIKHADRAATTVAISFTATGLEVEVCDAGATGADRSRLLGGDGVEPGFGLAGMRERVSFAGGTLEAGPDPGGGFRVRARFPLSEAAR